MARGKNIQHVKAAPTPQANLLSQLAGPEPANLSFSV